MCEQSLKRGGSRERLGTISGLTLVRGIGSSDPSDHIGMSVGSLAPPTRDLRDTPSTIRSPDK
jgi:hypothetical protein